MSTAPAQPHFPRSPGPDGAGSGADHPARRARQVAAVAAAGTAAALTGFFAVRAAQADDTSTADVTGSPAGSDTATGTGRLGPVTNGERRGSGGGYDGDGDGDRQITSGAIPGGSDQGWGSPDRPGGGSLVSGGPGGAASAVPGGAPASSSRGS